MTYKVWNRRKEWFLHTIVICRRCPYGHRENRWRQARCWAQGKYCPRVFLKETGETVAWNIFEASSMFLRSLSLTDDRQPSFEPGIAGLRAAYWRNHNYQATSKFVVGEIVEMVAHPDSTSIFTSCCWEWQNSTNRCWCSTHVGLKPLFWSHDAKGNLISRELSWGRALGWCAVLGSHKCSPKRGVIELSEDRQGTPRSGQTLDSLL